MMSLLVLSIAIKSFSNGAIAAELTPAPVPAATPSSGTLTSHGVKTQATPLTPQSPPSAKNLTFEDQSVTALDGDYSKLDVTDLNSREHLKGSHLYNARMNFKPEQDEMIKNWGVGE